MNASRERFCEAIEALMLRWDDERDDDALWLAAVKDDWSLAEFLGAGLAETFASEAPLEVEVCVIEGIEAFITAVRGEVTVTSLAEIEESLQPEIDDYYAEGPGMYLVFPEHFEGQAADYEAVGHSWEIPPGWGANLSEVRFLGPLEKPDDD